MITKNLFSRSGRSFLILFSLQYLFQSGGATKCSPSACGTIRNISFPFRLKNDPNNCDHRRGSIKTELVCENDVAYITHQSHKYLVKEINYHNLTIWLSRLSPNNSNICSFPTSSDDIFSMSSYLYYHPVTFMRCNHLLHNSSLFTHVTQCGKIVSTTHSYIKVGEMLVKDIEYMCTVEAIVATSWNFADLNNASLSEIHQSLLYGFNLPWFVFGYDCGLSGTGRVVCDKPMSFLQLKWKYNNIRDSFRSPQGPFAGCLVIFLFIVAVLFAGVSIPAKILIAFGTSYWLFVKNWYPKDIKHIIVVSFQVRFVVGFLCAMCFLIYKFKRRRMSMYEEIEDFLQSDNKLAPIRYSYSDIKKMTRGFREKLGQGGFGSVYKGKLQSGHHVAVKILGNLGANDKDFINEIGTIGRIHHVNVVKLVGYCAQRSKRVLIFDFMPNGSLDKYIFDHKKAYSLEWDVKYKIAVGVARGIEYLHGGCDIQILHFDIKPHNILLDDKFVPKVSDFGLAKLCSKEKDAVTLTAARGTIGYVAPELINASIGRVSYKADVYSFGMMLIDMVGLNRDLRRNNDDSSKYFPYWIYESFNQGGGDIETEKAEEETNGNDENENIKNVTRKLTIVALWCIQMCPDDRPSMNKVLDMLEGDVERLQIPRYPSQSTDMVINEDESSCGTCSNDSASLSHQSDAFHRVQITIEE